MTTETTVTDAADIAPEVSEPTSESEQVTPTDSGDPGTPESEPEKPQKTPEQIELDRLRRQLTKRDRTQGAMHQRLQALESELQQTRQAKPPTDTDEPITPERIKKFVEEEATRRAESIAAERLQQQQVQQTVQAILKEGKALEGFDESVKTVHEEVPLFDEKTGKPSALFEAISECDAPAKVLHYLGQNPDVAGELDGLTPTRLGRRLEAIERDMAAAAKPKTSSAPKPLTPVKPQGAAGIPSPTDTEAWIKWRNDQTRRR
jgi:hypothetical protein